MKPLTTFFDALFNTKSPKSTQKGLTDYLDRRTFGTSVALFNDYNRNNYGDVDQPNYELLFKEGSQGLASRCVDLIASNIANAQILVYKKENQTENSEPDKHPFLKLIYGKDQPNKSMSIMQMLYNAVQRYLVIGNEYWLVIRNNSGVPINLYPLKVTQSNQMIAMLDKLGDIMQWKYIGRDRKEYIYDASDIIHFKRQSPYYSPYGMGLIIAGAWIFDKQAEINKYQMRYFANDAMKRFVIMSDSDVGEAEFEDLKNSFKKEYMGNATNTLILNRGFKAESISNTPQESDYFNTWNAIQDDICSLFGIPPSLVSRIADVNRANAVSAEYDFNNNTLKPIADMIGDILTRVLVNNYKNSEEYIVKLKLRRPQDTEYELKQIQILTNTGSISQEELRQWSDYPQTMNGTPVQGKGNQSMPQDNTNNNSN